MATLRNSRIAIVGAAGAVSSSTALAMMMQQRLIGGIPYSFKAELIFTTPAVGTGARFAVNGTVAATRVGGRVRSALTATTESFTYFSAYNVPAAATATSLGTAPTYTTIEGIVQLSATGLFQLMFASETAGQTVTVQPGSNMIVIPMG